MKEGKSVNLAELLAGVTPPEWLRDMRRHYQATGTYRPEDIRRLVGDSSRSGELHRQLEKAANESKQK